MKQKQKMRRRIRVGRLLAVSAVLALGLMDVSVAGADASAPAGCSAWALQDHKDGTGYMFGSGGITCSGKDRLGVQVKMYGDGNLLASSKVADCSHASACSAHTPQVLDRWSGRQEWCTQTVANAFGGTRYTEWGCVLH